MDSMTYTRENIGEIVTYENEHGVTTDERIVEAYCSVCGAGYIGPIRQAGGFIAGHNSFHAWELAVHLDTDAGLSA